MSETKAMVQYGSYEMDAALEEQSDLEKQGGGEFMKLHVGKNIVRFLPPPLGTKSPFKVVPTHFVAVPGEDNNVSIPCQLQFKQPCPICTWASQLKAKGDAVSLERGKDLSAKRRVYANVIDRENPEAGPLILAFGRTIHEALVALRTDEDVGGDFTHPEHGYDIQITRVGSGRNDTEYKVFRHKNDSKLECLDWIDAQHDLSVFAKQMTKEEIKAKIQGEKSEKTEPDRKRLPAKVVGSGTASVPPAPRRRFGMRSVEQDAMSEGAEGADFENGADSEELPF